MKTTWVLVTDSSKARILSTENPKESLIEVEVLDHPQGRQHAQTLTTDLPGKAMDSSGKGRHAMGNTTEPKRQEAIVFAREIADKLNKSGDAKEYDQLILFAPPTFLGILREQLSNNTAKKIIHDDHKNLVQHTIEEIKAHLPFPLRPVPA